MDIIASTDNIHIKNAAALKQKKYRDKTNLFLPILQQLRHINRVNELCPVHPRRV